MGDVSLCLWFDGQAAEAAKFYTSLVKNSYVLDVAAYSAGMPLPEGSLMSVRFVLDGVEFTALNGGPDYTFTPAVSVMVTCDTQEEVDRLWAAFTEGGQEVQCGWLVDKFGVSWQIVPKGLYEMLSSPDREAANRATSAMLPMKKLDIAALRRAFDGG